jgi:phosphoribosylformimino-5-aminoimidazole carboxamide ribotide isomerase
MIEIIPAIDLMGGQCVRLTKGDFGSKASYGDPIEIALKFEDAGFKKLHLVDLDGARTGKVQQLRLLAEIASRTDLAIDFGGGIKSKDDVQRVFDSGAAQINLGSIAVSDEGLTSDLLNTFGAEAIVFAMDVKNGRIATRGWQELEELSYADFLSKYVARGARNFLSTSVEADGTLEGPDTAYYSILRKLAPQSYLIASGGVSRVEDIEELEAAGMDAVIVGRALLEGKILLTECGRFL